MKENWWRSFVECRIPIVLTIDMVLYFDKEYYEATTLDKTLYAVAYTEEGEQHLYRLNRGWSRIKKQLEKNAYVTLKTAIPLETIDQSWISKGGKIIPEKIDCLGMAIFNEMIK